MFTLASALCGAAPTVELLVAARAVKALGAALLVPASLALVVEAFPGERGSLAAFVAITPETALESDLAAANTLLNRSTTGHRGGDGSTGYPRWSGNAFGEIGVHERILRTATVPSTTASTVLRIYGNAFLESLVDARTSTALLEGDP